MKSKITRSEFLKLAGAGSFVLGASLLLSRDSSYSWTGIDSAGPSQPVSLKTCSTPHLERPYLQRARCSGDLQPIDWQTATSLVAETLRRYAPGEIAFLLGLYPDHLNHLVRLLAERLGGIQVLRFDPLAEFEGRVTLMDAAQKLFGLSQLPLFDLSQADLIFSFGADLNEPWIASNKRNLSRPSRLIHFSAHRPAGLEIDQWIPIRPGSEAVLAQWLHRSLAGRVEPEETKAAAATTGLGRRELTRFARLFGRARRRLALPSGASLSAPDGLIAAQWILSLNLLGELAAQNPAFSLTTPPSLYPDLSLRPSSTAELVALFTRLRMGEIKTLFIHGIDPLGALPSAFKAREALAQAEQVISFSPFLDATSAYADLLLPDHLPTELWGYQIMPNAADWSRISALIPQSARGQHAPSTADLLLNASRSTGYLPPSFDFQDERDFLRRSLLTLPFSSEKGWLAQGGWQREHAVRFPPILQLQPGLATHAGGLAPDQLYFQVYPDRSTRAQTTLPRNSPRNCGSARNTGWRAGMGFLNPQPDQPASADPFRSASAHSRAWLAARVSLPGPRSARPGPKCVWRVGFLRHPNPVAGPKFSINHCERSL